MSQALGAGEIALLIEPACFSEKLDGVILIALAARLANVHHEFVGRIFKQAPAHLAGVGLLCQALCFLDLAGSIKVTRLLEGSPRVGRRVGACIRRLAGRGAAFDLANLGHDLVGGVFPPVELRFQRPGLVA